MLEEKDFIEIVEIGIALAAEKDENKLYSKILDAAMELVRCDSGTLYLYKHDKLVLKNMKTISRNMCLGDDGNDIEVPEIEMTDNNICAYSALHREFINVEDIYNDERFNFENTKHYDTLTGYRTKSMIVMPMQNSDGILVGVLQLFNAMSEDGRTIAFNETNEYIVRMIGAQSAVAITNRKNVEEIKKQMYSFVEAFSTIIDKRSPYNASHTMKVTHYAGLVIDEINRQYNEGTAPYYFDDNRREQLLLAAGLHDIGKMVIPLRIMNKATRLEDNIDEIKKRFTLIEAYYEIDQLKNIISMEKYKLERDYLWESFELIEKINTIEYVSDALIEKVRLIAHHSYHKSGGETIPYLTPYELECLCIRRGTLTEQERKQMESHVIMTRKILEKVRFNQNYSNVRRFATTHHELLDGSGYPDGLKGDSLELETRILAALDIYDALTSKDRPYKKPVSKEDAFEILTDMVKEGKLDIRVVGYMKNAL